MNAYLNRKFRKVIHDLIQSPSGWLRYKLAFSGPGYARLILPPIEQGCDGPDQEYKDWGARVSNRLGGRIPGNWRTSRGTKKRIHFLLRNFPVS